MQGTPSSHIENLGLYGPQVAQKIADRGASDLCQSGDSPSPMGKAESDCCSHLAERQGSADVGTDAEHLSDEERERSAYRFGCAMNGWYSLYQRTGDTAYLDRAYDCLGAMKRLLAARSPEYVAKLEAERGLA